ncbi:transcriptional repressor [Thermobispora bispora]|uniref:Ferric uptake regulator, Fur family n=1 Tax=Thermobispora bispora (strain ATCC 19993 / DSM 43833 / CBS 139.67 / JCM 10125 / KCTC 9307 / NBRC 14880 / R51) TaxID=469371 RepID=D6Y8K4_THEBD|nr:Fur family transcriptional regulator [Thermobispora bispora]MBO2473785.1 transcriptional repressor [Actinomycetales bacterium]MDI9579445.1 Fur family transcriptional regulator [Thermobispora sp.]ADG87901.1 ferric uptake regulator, Fur family [Thermobispora bispora DSM 43833]MBX6169260.1 transcriptional repressor [Thermobispora bispora]QSI47782.1 transcriptional repressor [Thermobispora bispora]
MTKSREAVHKVLRQSAGFRSAQDVFAEMRACGSKIGLTTVYRALQSLQDAGRVDVLRTDDGESVYRACETETHHHHLVCRKCGLTVEVTEPSVERWAEHIGLEHGFTDVTHTVEVFGTCSACAAKTEKAGKAEKTEKAAAAE